MEQAFVCHFYSMRWREVKEMPFSEFTRLLRCANMLNARKRQGDIAVSSFPHSTEQAQNEFIGKLAKQSTEFIARKLTDYKEFAKTLAMELMRRG